MTACVDNDHYGPEPPGSHTGCRWFPYTDPADLPARISVPRDVLTRWEIAARAHGSTLAAADMRTFLYPEEKHW